MRDDPWLPERLRREALVRKGERRVERAAAEIYAALATITREAFNADTGHLDEAVLDARDPRYVTALDGLLNVIGEIFTDAYTERANKVSDRFNPPPVTAAVRIEPDRPPLPPTLVEHAVFDHLYTVRNRVVDMPNFVFNQIRDELETGRRLGESIPKLAARIEALGIEGMSTARAVTIARTEVIAAYNAGNHIATMDTAKQYGVESDKVVRMWLATMDAVTRETHAEADGQQVAGEQTYTVGDDELLFPGDPAGSGGEVINCRCTEEFLLPGDPAYPEEIPATAVAIDPSDAVRGINPLYTTGGMPYNVNCTNTTGTLELAMRGEQGLQAAGVFGRTGVTPYEFFNRWRTPTGKPPFGTSFEGNVTSLVEHLDKTGGRRAFVVIRLRNGGGHIFNAVRNSRQQWEFWDGQQGLQINKEWMSRVSDGQWMVQRSDNLRCVDRKGMVDE